MQQFWVSRVDLHVCWRTGVGGQWWSQNDLLALGAGGSSQSLCHTRVSSVAELKPRSSGPRISQTVLRPGCEWT
ncbi:hypothetical protein CesoFtcFv8_023430 [Champsocephalus esox]|uniref:Uncharacterized protein n=1 Tax=Champsocephalus esox TaxID=159716 RepID=A0AAN8B8T0_9TELE|nr:hypothetical protein CesoFtcFv8_023430 [Champsocephalus esox]